MTLQCWSSRNDWFKVQSDQSWTYFLIASFLDHCNWCFPAEYWTSKWGKHVLLYTFKEVHFPEHWFSRLFTSDCVAKGGSPTTTIYPLTNDPVSINSLCKQTHTNKITWSIYSWIPDHKVWALTYCQYNDNHLSDSRFFFFIYPI